MPIQLPTYPNPYSALPLTNAIAWINFLSLDFSAAEPHGRLEVSINVDAAAAAAYKQPINKLGFVLGRDFGANHHVPSFAELMADPEFAAAFSVVRSKLYDMLLTLPQFDGGELV